MKKIILIYLFFISLLFSHEIVLNNDSNKTLHSNDSDIYITNDSTLTVLEVRNKEFKTIKKTNFPRSSNIIWTKYKLKNSSKLDKKLFLRNSRAGIDFIDVYIFKDNVLIKNFFLGDLRKQDDMQFISRKSVFSFNFLKNSEYELVFKYRSLGALSNKWEIFDEREFIIQEGYENVIWGLVSGLVLSIIVYNLMFFINTKNYAFLFYILASFSSLGYILSSNGIFYQLNLGINLYLITISTWLFAYSFLIFTFLFIINFFNERKDSITYKIILAVLAVQVIIIILLSIGFYDNTYHYTFAKLDYTALLSTFLILVFALIEFIRKKVSAIYFLVGQAIYITCFTYFTLELIGLIAPFNYSWVILPIGISFEILFISIALNSKLKIVEKEKEKMKEHYLEQSRFINAGKTVSYIVHQLKHPIAQLGSQINLIEAVYLLDRKNLVETIEKKMPSLKASLDYINDVSHSVSTLFINPNGKESFNLKKQIDTLLLLQKDKIQNYKIDIHEEYKLEDIYTFRGTFSNVFMVILENAIYELKTKDYEKFIRVNSYKLAGFVYITIADNAGGIPNLKKVFDDDYSKKDSDGSGIGLSLAKVLTQKKLEGDLSVINTKFGAKFIIKIPLYPCVLEENK